MKKTAFALFSLCLALSATAQPTSSKLSGTVIGTAECYDYTSGQLSYTVNTPANLFDNDMNSFMAAYERSGAWAGLDLGSPHVITKVAFAPRLDGLGQGRLLLGLFEGANNPDFGDALPLFMNSQLPASGTMTEAAVDCSRAFRYVRYVGPNDARCNIAELAFYGYTGTGNDSRLAQLTNLPTITIHTTNAQDIVSKEDYIKGIVSVISNNGTQIYTDSLDIRGRGNASWDFPKKPYRMKLYNKTNLLGLPAREKNWTLINNYGDKTLMRNLLAFDLSRRVELAYTPAGLAVDVILNGEYKGTYQLCDQIEVASGRVEIDKLKPTDTTLPTLSGGYLLEMDAYAYSETSWFASAQRQIPVSIKYPKDDEIVQAQTSYITNHFNAFESALFGSNYANPTSGYRRYLDVATFVRHFLVGEISGNTDTYWSTYLYKNRNDDRLFVGPVWDFDIAFENDGRTYPINNNPDFIYATTGSYANGVRDLVNRLLSDPDCYQELREAYADYRDNGRLNADTLAAVVDAYALQLDASQRLNFMRWDIMNNYVHQNPRVYGSYAGEVANVRSYIRNRIAWMDRKLNYVPSAIEQSPLATLFLQVEGRTVTLRGVEQPLQLTVYDTQGRQLHHQRIESAVTLSLPQGIYLFQCKNDGGMSEVLKCILP